MKAQGISANMIVKNEDVWVWYAIQSVLPFVDELLITDTGSSDNTIQLIKSIDSPKIKFQQVICHTSAEVTAIRSRQLEDSKNSWIWIVDGDEIYTEKTARECVEVVKSNKYEGIVVRRYDLLGDIYHRQIESVGTYKLFGYSGHLLVRLINKDKIKGLKYKGDYPNEGFFDGADTSILNRDPMDWYITNNYLYHSMYLKRSSMGGNLPMFNRSKFKIEKGILIHDDLPGVFSLPTPESIPNPLLSRGKGYEIISSIITPIKNLKRKLL